MSRAKLYPFDKVEIENTLRDIKRSKRWLAQQIGKEYTGFLKRFKSGKMQKAELMAILKAIEDYSKKKAEPKWAKTITAYDDGIYRVKASLKTVKAVKSLGELLVEWSNEQQKEFQEFPDDPDEDFVYIDDDDDEEEEI